MIIKEIAFEDEIIEYIDCSHERDYEYNFKVNDGIYFSDDIWDFNNKNTLDKKKGLYQYNFLGLDYRYKFHLKMIVLELLVSSKKNPSTIRVHYYAKIKEFIMYLQYNNIFNANRITLEAIKTFFNNKKGCTERYNASYKTAIAKFLSEIEIKNKNVSFSEIYKYLNKRDWEKRNAEAESSKTKIIPNIIFDNMVACAINDIKDNKIAVKDKLAACMIVILAETGMRIGEFARLEIDKLRVFKIDNERQINYLEFITYKTITHQEGEYRWTEAYMTDIAAYAYNEMCKISKQHRESVGTKYAYFYKPRSRKKEFIKYDENTIRYHLTRFVLRHYDELGLDKIKNPDNFYWTTITKSNIHLVGKEFEDLLGKEVINIRPHQFRVTVCTKLYNQNVPLEFIRKHMNHLDEDMTAHYIRMKSLDNKKIQAIKAIKDRMDQKGELLDVNAAESANDLVKSELSKKEIRKEYQDINKFLKKSKFKIMRDLDQIIDVLIVSNTPLTQTPEGYCARTALASICERQSYISSVNDAYHVGAYVPAMECADITYRIFLEKRTLVEHNKNVADKNQTYKLEYKRELKALKLFIEKRLLPEFEMVKNYIDNNGIDKINEYYPNLISISGKIEDLINKEVMQWMN